MARPASQKIQGPAGQFNGLFTEKKKLIFLENI